MWSCTVPSCENDLRKTKFFAFPANLERRKLWTLKCNLIEVPCNAKICEDHFEKSQFLLGQDVKKLKPDAVPSLFLGTPKVNPIIKDKTESTNKFSPQKTKSSPPKIPSTSSKQVMYTLPSLFSNPVKLQKGNTQIKVEETCSIPQVVVKNKNKSSFQSPAKKYLKLVKSSKSPVNKLHTSKCSVEDKMIKKKSFCQTISVSNSLQSLDCQSSPSSTDSSSSVQKNVPESEKLSPVKDVTAVKAQEMTHSAQSKENCVCLPTEDKNVAKSDLISISLAELPDEQVKHHSDTLSHSPSICPEHQKVKNYCDCTQSPDFLIISSVLDNILSSVNSIEKILVIGNSVQYESSDENYPALEDNEQKENFHSLETEPETNIGLLSSNSLNHSVPLEVPDSISKQVTPSLVLKTKTIDQKEFNSEQQSIKTEGKQCSQAAIQGKMQKCSNQPCLNNAVADTNENFDKSRQVPNFHKRKSIKIFPTKILKNIQHDEEEAEMINQNPHTKRLKQEKSTFHRSVSSETQIDRNDNFNNFDELVASVKANYTSLVKYISSSHQGNAGSHMCEDSCNDCTSGQKSNVEKAICLAQKCKKKTKKKVLSPRSKLKNPKSNKESYSALKQFINIHDQTFEVVDHAILHDGTFPKQDTILLKEVASFKRIGRPETTECISSTLEDFNMMDSSQAIRKETGVMSGKPLVNKRKLNEPENETLGKKVCLDGRCELSSSCSLKKCGKFVKEKADQTIACMEKDFSLNVGFSSVKKGKLLKQNPKAQTICFDVENLSQVVPQMKQWSELLTIELINLRETYKAEQKKLQLLLKSQRLNKKRNKKLKREKEKLQNQIIDAKHETNNYKFLVKDLKLKVCALTSKCSVRLEKLNLPNQVVQYFARGPGPSSQTGARISNCSILVKKLSHQTVINCVEAPGESLHAERGGNKLVEGTSPEEKELEFQKKLLKMLKIKNENKKIDLLIKEFENGKENELLKQRIKELENEKKTMLDENLSMLEEIEHFMSENKRLGARIATLESERTKCEKKVPQKTIVITKRH